MTDITDIFFELVQVADGSRNRVSRILTDEQWLEVCRMAYKHSMLGIAFAGLDNLPKEQCPSKRPMVKMYNEAEKIRRKNLSFEEAIPKVSDYFREGGFECVLIKGQGIARYYPDPFLRNPGDIDMWVSGTRRSVTGYARALKKDAKPCYHHVDCADIAGCEVEAHFTPSWMFNPVYNYRLQRWFRSSFPSQAANRLEFQGRKVAVTTLAFNRVFVLIHIFRHLFDEGIGLRQLQDYYYILKQGFSEKERGECVEVLRSIGLLGFASAVMYVLEKVFALPGDCMLVESDARQGEFLLSEILLSGNFGHFDSRSGGPSKLGEAGEFFRRMKRMAAFMKYYPSEVISAPLFKFYNFFIRHFI